MNPIQLVNPIAYNPVKMNPVAAFYASSLLDAVTRMANLTKDATRNKMPERSVTGKSVTSQRSPRVQSLISANMLPTNKTAIADASMNSLAGNNIVAGKHITTLERNMQHIVQNGLLPAVARESSGIKSAQQNLIQLATAVAATEALVPLTQSGVKQKAFGTAHVQNYAARSIAKNVGVPMQESVQQHNSDIVPQPLQHWQVSNPVAAIVANLATRVPDYLSPKTTISEAATGGGKLTLLPIPFPMEAPFSDISHLMPPQTAVNIRLPAVTNPATKPMQLGQAEQFFEERASIADRQQNGDLPGTTRKSKGRQKGTVTESGGRNSRTVNVNRPLIENLSIYVADGRTAMHDFRQQVERVLLEVLQG
jgi:hypothetical protein